MPQDEIADSCRHTGPMPTYLRMVKRNFDWENLISVSGIGHSMNQSGQQRFSSSQERLLWSKQHNRHRGQNCKIAATKSSHQKVFVKPQHPSCDIRLLRFEYRDCSCSDDTLILDAMQKLYTAFKFVGVFALFIGSVESRLNSENDACGEQ